jgi:predicted aminopeptidase
MILVWLAGVLVAGLGAAYAGSREVRYLSRAGFEESRILANARPLTDAATDPKADAATRALLHLVLEVRDSAASLGLAAKDTYTTYSDVGRDTLLLALSAAPGNCICAYQWKYPIVGKIPYKGFFDFAEARRTAADFQAKGYDTYLRPAAAFSTLGWFKDPLLSTAMSHDSVELASLVFHEIAHNTLYVKSATPFNESFAQYVGYRSAEWFFRQRGDTALATRAANRWHDEIMLEGYYRSLVARLDTLYASKPDSAALAAGRAAAAHWSKEQLEGPVGDSLRTFKIGKIAERPINNAALVGVLLYRTDLARFDAWHHAHGDDIRASVSALRELLEGADGDQARSRLRAHTDSLPGT